MIFLSIYVNLSKIAIGAGVFLFTGFYYWSWMGGNPWGWLQGSRGSIVLFVSFWWVVVFDKPHKIEILNFTQPKSVCLTKKWHVNKKVGNQKIAVIYGILFQILEFTRRSSKLKILHMVLLNILVSGRVRLTSATVILLQSSPPSKLLASSPLRVALML